MSTMVGVCVNSVCLNLSAAGEKRRAKLLNQHFKARYGDGSSIDPDTRVYQLKSFDVYLDSPLNQSTRDLLCSCHSLISHCLSSTSRCWSPHPGRAGVADTNTAVDIGKGHSTNGVCHLRSSITCLIHVCSLAFSFLQRKAYIVFSPRSPYSKFTRSSFTSCLSLARFLATRLIAFTLCVIIFCPRYGTGQF